MSAEIIESIKERIAYNSHDLGEFGKVIRLEYVFNILDELALKTVTQDDANRAISYCERDLGLLSDRIMKSIRTSPYDFRTVGSLGRELGVPRDIMLQQLAELESEKKVRRPVVPDAKYDEWYRDVSRGLTRQERWARWWAIMTFQRMRDDF